MEATDDLALLGFPPEMCRQKPTSVLKANQGHARGRSNIGAELELASTSLSPVRLWLPFHLLWSRVVRAVRAPIACLVLLACDRTGEQDAVLLLSVK